MGRRLVAALGTLCLVLLLTGCGDAEADRAEAKDGRLLAIDLDKGGEERLLDYYLGAYADARDPQEVGLLKGEEGARQIDLEALEAAHPGLAAQLEAAARDGSLDWDEFAAFLQATFYDVRQLPPTYDALRQHVRFDEREWFTVEVEGGTMTQAVRRVYVPMDALRSALEGYHEQGEELIYPVGTTIFGEHWLDGEHAETTAMTKRADGYWDFFTYGPDGALAAETATPPRSLESPTQCAGCHFGERQFEPEKSFPAEAPDGPHGPRALLVDEDVRDMEVTRFFNEHARRSDTVLGLYGTLFVAELRAQERTGAIAPEDAELLRELGF